LNKDDHSYAFRFYFRDKINGRHDELPEKKYLVVRARSFLASPLLIQAGLTDENGSVMAAEFKAAPGKTVFRIPLKKFKPAEYLIIPRPFPDFLPYRIQGSSTSFDWSSTETLQLEIRSAKKDGVNLQIERVWLE
jgi:hypothetical protein